MPTPQDRVIELLEEQVSDLKKQLFDAKQVTVTSKYMDLHTASAYTSLSESTLRRGITKGELKCSKRTGKVLFRTEYIDRWLDFK